MIGAPHALHTHSRSTSYIYNVFQHLFLWLVLVVIKMQSQPDMLVLTVTMVDGCRRFTRILTWNVLSVMIGAPHTFHTHSRSTSYIDNVFHHLRLWLVVIRMQPTPWYLICPLGPAVSSYDWEPPIPFILIPCLLYTYIMKFSICYSG
jgi:hypothetical protein